MMYYDDPGYEVILWQIVLPHTCQALTNGTRSIEATVYLMQGASISTTTTTQRYLPLHLSG